MGVASRRSVRVSARDRDHACRRVRRRAVASRAAERARHPEPGRHTHQPGLQRAATPGGLLRFWREKRLVNSLTGLLVAGTLPGVVVGAVIRVELLSSSRAFTWV